MRTTAMNNGGRAATAARFMVLFIAQGAFSGRSPFAPGTAGTLVGVLLYLLLRNVPPHLYSVLAASVAGLGIWAAGRAERILGRTDHPSIVIDEIAGYLVTMMLVPGTWPYLAAGFVLFRFFDIVKPFPIRRLQQLHGGTGVVLDDIGAGIYANIVLQIALYSGILDRITG